MTNKQEIGTVCIFTVVIKKKRQTHALREMRNLSLKPLTKKNNSNKRCEDVFS